MKHSYPLLIPRSGLARLLAFVLVLAPMLARAQATVLSGPTGSGSFGSIVKLLPNGNYVVTDPDYSVGGVRSVGAVYLYSGQTNTLISTLTGSQQNDRVGGYGVTVLPSGNFVVQSGAWANGAAPRAGAVTWGSATSGVSGPVSAANSLVGAHADDWVGNNLSVLPNGSYVVISPSWTNGAVMHVGAVTWSSGTSGLCGLVSAANSLVGSQTNDSVGSSGIRVLTNGNYVVDSGSWANGAAMGAGAITWSSGASGITGPVSAANSLVGSQPYDYVGFNGIVLLPNGNYVVGSFNWANGPAARAGAATWGSGTSGVSGPVSAANSLVGTQANDLVSLSGITPLANGNYVVSSRQWANGTVSKAGAATWGSGTSGVQGTISAANSLVGTRTDDQVGSSTTALPNGHYVVGSNGWANGLVARTGAATWGNGTSGIRGTISAANSLIGTQANDQVGISITALANGHYVVGSSNWAAGTIVQVGAATWGNGTSGVSGPVTTSNSLVGSQPNDNVGASIVALPNGHYVVGSSNWANGSAAQAGAATWGSGTSGIRGPVSTANSLVGSRPGDQVGIIITPLPNGHYVVRSYLWANGSAAQAGAVTWGSGTGGAGSVVSAANSLVGSQTGDQAGRRLTVLANGNYVVQSYLWANGPAAQAGAATWGSGTSGVSGPISATNSLVGTQPNDQVGILAEDFANGTYLIKSFAWANGPLAGAGAVTPGSSNAPLGPITACNSIVGRAAGGGYRMAYDYQVSTGTLLGGLTLENKLQFGLNAPPPPTGATTQRFAAGATVASLVATGQNVQWYAAATGGSPLAITTPLVSGSSYYASQTIAGCESLSRLAVAAAQLLAVAPAALAQQVMLYPNPATGTAFVTLPTSLGRQAVAATLVDALGRPVRTLTLPAQGTVAHALGLHALPSGMYLLRLSTPAGTLVKKLTVE